MYNKEGNKMYEEKDQETKQVKSVVNREFKDRIFKFTFANEKNKEYTLSLYNAISGKSCTNPDDIEINTIDDMLYMTTKNDLSFLIDETMNIYEHQSSFNPNIPIRMFSYAAKVYEKYISKYIDKKIYTSKQQKLPIPKLICFYNGNRKTEDKEILSLRSAFDCENNTEPDIDVKVTMININYGHNLELMEKCKPLKEYSWFINRIRIYTNEYKKSQSAGYTEKAVDRAIEEMPSDWLLKPFLHEHRSEVRNMWTAEYTEQEFWDGMREVLKADAIADAIAEADKYIAEQLKIQVAEVNRRADEKVAEQVAEKVAEANRRADEAEERARKAEARLAEFEAEHQKN